MRGLWAVTLGICALSACTGVDRWAGIDHDLATVQQGTYLTDVHLEIRARLGPLPVGGATCDERVFLAVNPAADPAIVGTVTCDLPEVGEVEALLTGSIAMPYLDGAVESDDLDADWSGGFTDPDAFFGELEGTGSADGVQLRYEGWIEAVRVTPGAS